jgi:hypothetical protein
MRLHFLAARKDRSRELCALSADVIRLGAQVADRDKRLAMADDMIAELAVRHDWFHDNWETEHARANAAAAANQRLGAALNDANRKVRELERIAGPYVEARHTPSPIYTEVTGEHPLPVWPDNETTTELRTVGAGELAGAR